jgi:hypothetical protein
MMREEIIRMVKQFEERGWRLQPSSYQIRNRDGSPGGWIAQVHIWHDLPNESVVQPLLEREPRVYDSEEAANNSALSLGYSWLRQHAA